MRTIIPWLVACLFGVQVHAQQLTAAEYFVDNDPGVGNGTAVTITQGDIANVEFAMDASGIPVGFHTLSTRFKDTSGTWGHAVSRLFYVYGSGSAGNTPAAPIAAGEYFIDTDPGVGEATAFSVSSGNTVNATFAVDASDVPVGFHTLNMRFKDADGRWGHASSRLFYVYGGSGGSNDPAAPITAAEYFFDNDPGVGNGVALPTGEPQDAVSLNTVIDASALAVGTHKLSIRFRDQDGHWGHARTQAFVVLEEGALQNDECLGATVLPLQAFGVCVETPGSTEEATVSSASTCWGNEYADVWFAVNSGNSPQVTIDLSEVSATSVRIEVMDACDGSVSHCIEYYPYTFNTSLNTTYWLRVFAAGEAGAFGICASAAAEDCLGVVGGATTPGTACDDGSASTQNDQYQANCECLGWDCAGVLGGTAGPGTPCNYYTANDGVYDANCSCTYPEDCEGTPGGTALPGTPCDDEVATTLNDTWTADCACIGNDCLGVPGGSSGPGAPCPWNWVPTGAINPVINTQCGCSWTDCLGVANGDALPGSPCDDGLATTEYDTWSTDCNCVGVVFDCAGVADGTAYLDNCANCVGGTTGLTPCTADCNGVFGGTAYVDNCSVCVGGNTGLNPCTQDCNNVFGGTAYLDNCNVCVGGNTGLNPCTQDCNSVFGGTAFLDNCSVCVGGNTGLDPCQIPQNDDCVNAPMPFWANTSGNCIQQVGSTLWSTPSGGSCQSANNDVWYAFNTMSETTFITLVGTGAEGLGVEVFENGSCNGSGSIYCGSGNTHTVYTSNYLTTTYFLRVYSTTDGGFNLCVSYEPGTPDCNGDIGGSAYLDNCGECVGGDTGEEACNTDCNGVPGGTAFVDNCSTCVGGNTGLAACVQDCNNVYGGTATIDACSVCSGGNTGIPPNSTCLDCAGVPNGLSELDACSRCLLPSDPDFETAIRTLAFTGNGNFQNAVLFPQTGEPSTTYTAEVIYMNSENGQLPLGYPRLILDYEGDGVFNGPFDRTVLMVASDASDATTTDGKRYRCTVVGLPTGTNYQTRVQTAEGQCITQLGPFNYPDVLVAPDLEIFANDITFSTPNPAINSPLTVYARVHNRADYAAEGFAVRLVNEFEPGTVYPDITIPWLAARDTLTVSWNITTPNTVAWCPMRVTVDANNTIAETNELNNNAIRPFVNGEFNLPGTIAVYASVEPEVSVIDPNYPSILLTVSGYAYYSGTAVALQDSSVAGATVTINGHFGETYTGLTNSEGYFSLDNINSMGVLGDHVLTGEVTDYTLTGPLTAHYERIAGPPCVNFYQVGVTIDQVMWIGNTWINAILAGDTISGTITVQNSTCEDVLVPTRLDAAQTGGLPIIGDVIVPPLSAGESFTLSFSGIQFDDPGYYTICGTSDADLVLDDLNYHNTYCQGLTVFPRLPDIEPHYYGGIGNAFQCQVGEPFFGIWNHGAVPSGPFDCRVDVYRDGDFIQSFIHSVEDIGPFSWTGFSIPYVPPAVGNYTFVLACDVPLPNGIVVELNENNNSATYNGSTTACQADLSVNFPCEFPVTPVDPTFPGTVTYHAEIFNGGNAIALGPIDVTFTVSTGGNYTTQFAGDLLPGERIPVSVSAPSVAPATASLTVTVDPDNTVPEFNEGGSTSDQLCHEYYPTVCTSWGWPILPVLGQTTAVSVVLAGQHLYTASVVKVRFEVSGPDITGTALLGDVLVDPAIARCHCGVGVTLPGSFLFSSEGTYTFTFTVDPDNEYTECNEGNNVLTREVVITNLPDLRVLSQYINPSLLNPDVNEPVTLDVTYENIGYGNLGSTFDLKVMANNDELATVANVPGLVTGGTNTVSIPVPFSSPLVGVHVFRAIIDAEDEVVEGNELNNEATRAIVVGAAANLYFVSFTASTNTPSLGQNMTFTGIVRNNGDLPISAQVRFYYVNAANDTIPFNSPVSITLDSSAQVGIGSNWTVTELPRAIIARIVNGSMLEFTYTDNEARIPMGAITAQITSVPGCAAGPLGSLTAQVFGGVPPYTFVWSNDSTGATLNAVPGTYSLLFSDAEGRVGTAQGTIATSAECGSTCTLEAGSFAVSASCDPNDGLYDAELVLTYTQPPASGSLNVNGVLFPITGSPQSISIELPAGPISIAAYFTADPGCAAGLADIGTLAQCTVDCNGVYGGTAFLDNCAECVGGNTGLTACVQDCNGDYGGTAFIDACATCVGGNTGLAPCSITCTENVTIELRTDALSAQASWQILAQNTNEVVCQFTVPMNGVTTPIAEDCCLDPGCYRLRVYDSGGDGFVNGGYQLRESGPNGRRIIDNLGNFNTGSTSAIADTYESGAFCVPIGTDQLIHSSCDKLDWVNNKFIVASANDAVSAQYGVTNTTSGYEFWFFDPNGSYSFRRFRSHATSDGFGTGATRACHFKVNGWVNSTSTPHLPNNVLLNVRVRGRVAGGNLAFGPACRFKLDAALAACPRVKLQDDPANTADFSCGVNLNFGGSSNANNRITANPPQPIPTVASSAVRYQFRFRIPGENVCIVRPPQTSARLVLNWTSGTPLQCSKTYDVDVRVSLDGGTTWCFGPATASQAAACADTQDWGKVCSVTINPCAGANGGTNSMVIDGNSNLTIYPNPNRGDQLFVNLISVGEGVNTVNVDIFDLTGKKVSTRAIAVQDGFVNSALELEGELSNGMYLVNITAGTKAYTERLVIQK